MDAKQLAEIKARAETTSPDLIRDIPVVRRVLKEDVPALVADLEKVRRRHRPIVKELDFTNCLVEPGQESVEVQVCAECDRIREEIDETAEPVLWPCSTVRDLDGDTTTETRKDAA